MFSRAWCALVVTLGLGLLVDCRCRTTYAPEVTARCMDEAARTVASRDGGHPAVDLTEHKRLCEQCCHDHGLEAVDPGTCECGKLGLDVLTR